MNEEKLYEVPEILPGDLIECLATGGQGIIGRESQRHNSHPTAWSIAPLPGARIKSAWWSREEFKVVEKGPAHKGWAEALKVQKEQDEQNSRERDIDWVTANWEDLEGKVGLSVAQTLITAAGVMPDQTGLLMRGEIGIAAYQVIQIYRTYEDDFKEAMTGPDPKAALAELGKAILEQTPA